MIKLTDQDGFTRLEGLDFTTIGRVEIIRGSASSLYGTANSGVMNFTSEKASFGKTSIQYGGLLGSYGLSRNGFVFKHGSEKANIYASTTSQGSNGYRRNNRSDRDSVNFAGQFFLTSRLSINTVFARLNDNVRYSLALTYDQARLDPSQDAPTVTPFVAATAEVPVNPVIGTPTRPATPRNLARPASFYGAGRDQSWTRCGVNAKYKISDALKFSAS